MPPLKFSFGPTKQGDWPAGYKSMILIHFPPLASPLKPNDFPDVFWPLYHIIIHGSDNLCLPAILVWTKISSHYEIWIKERFWMRIWHERTTSSTSVNIKLTLVPLWQMGIAELNGTTTRLITFWLYLVWLRQPLFSWVVQKLHETITTAVWNNYHWTTEPFFRPTQCSPWLVGN